MSSSGLLPPARGLGVFGGSFDPVHIAHLLVGERVRESLGLERVLFVPAERQPLKPTGPVAPGQDRLEMLRLAVAGHPDFEASPLELERGGLSYTVDTLEDLHRRHPESELFLILGSDACRLLNRWRGLERIRELARVVRVPRVGRVGCAGEDPEGVSEPSTGTAGDAFSTITVDVPALEISASDIRARFARGASVRFLVPEAVRAYILGRRLYRT